MRAELGALQAAVDARCASLAAAGAPGSIFQRDDSFWGGDAARKSSVANRLGWLNIASTMLAEAPALEEFGREALDAGFTSAVVLGMGGSSLAPEVLRLGIPPREDAPRLYVLDTTDPASIHAVEHEIDLDHTLFFVSSKSGTTIEPLSLFAHFHALVEERHPGHSGRQFVAITDAGTPLQDLASERGFRRVFTNPSDIGGRYSALSYFGLVPAAAAGIDIARLLESGAQAERTAGAADSDALRLGAILGEAALAGRNKCTLVVAPAIAAFGLWAEQLIAESTGKEGGGILPVAGEPYATPLKYGDDRIFVQLRLENDSNGENDNVIGGLRNEGHPVVVIDLDSAYDLGREFYRWEFATAIAGRVLGINPFDEPNVQESKDNTLRVLNEFGATGTLETANIDPASDAIAISTDGVQRSLTEAVARLFEHVRPGDYFAITAYTQQTLLSDAVFADIRSRVLEATGVATTLGYGPRFLHSTGQLHKGGPPQGVFLQVTVDDSEDVAIPGKPFTFGQLKRAQAIGDFASIASHGRPVLRVHLQRMDAGLLLLRDSVRDALSAAHARR